MNWYKQAELWDEIKRYGPMPPGEPLRFRPEDYDLSLAMEKLKRLNPELTEEQIKQKILKEPGIYELYRRDAFISNYAHSVPSQRAIEKIKEFVGNDKIIEVGAGYGLWAKLLQEEGINITPTDLPIAERRAQYPIFTKDIDFTTVEELNNLEAMQQYGGFGVLMMAWPPYDDPMAYKTLKVFRGNKTIFIGEDEGGCTGCDKFFKLLNRKWKNIGYIDIPQWWGMHDYLSFYVRK